MSYNTYFEEANKDLSLAQKIQIITINNAKAKELTSVISSLENAHTIKEEPQINISTPKAQAQAISPTINEVSVALSILDIDTLDDEEASAKIKKILNTSISNAYLLGIIKFNLYQEIVEYNKMLLSSDNALEMTEINKQIAMLKRKIQLLEYAREEEELIETSTEDNNIYFLTSTLGNIFFKESLRKNVPLDYYQAFKELLLTIKNGTFKGLKKLKDIPYFEVKDFKIRIIFTHLEGNNFLILDAFMKKADTSIQISNILKNRASNIAKIKESICHSLTDPNFIATQNSYYEEIISMLDESNNTLKRG